MIPDRSSTTNASPKPALAASVCAASGLLIWLLRGVVFGLWGHWFLFLALCGFGALGIALVVAGLMAW